MRISSPKIVKPSLKTVNLSPTFSHQTAKKIIKNYFSIVQGTFNLTNLNLKELTVPKEAVVIHSNNVNCYANLTSITFEGSISHFPRHCFQDIPKFQTIRFSCLIPSFESGLFRNCPFLKLITLPPNLISLPDFWFGSCPKLEIINFSNCIESFGSYCFYECSYIKSEFEI